MQKLHWKLSLICYFKYYKNIYAAEYEKYMQITIQKI